MFQERDGGECEVGGHTAPEIKKPGTMVLLLLRFCHVFSWIPSLRESANHSSTFLKVCC